MNKLIDKATNKIVSLFFTENKHIPNLLVIKGDNTRRNHLIHPNEGETFCGRLETPYNINGKIDEQQTYPFNGFNNALGKWCSYCIYQYEQRYDESVYANLDRHKL